MAHRGLRSVIRLSLQTWLVAERAVLGSWIFAHPRQTLVFARFLRGISVGRALAALPNFATGYESLGEPAGGKAAAPG